MKKLPITKIWTGDGYGANYAITLNQIKRTETVALYERIRKNGVSEGFELFIIKLRKKGDPLPGGAVEEDDREVYPSANSFGRTAWHIHNKAYVLQRFDELVNGKAEAETVDEETEETEVICVHPVVRVRKTQNKINSILNLPAEPFSQKDLAKFNQIENYKEVYSQLQQLISSKAIVFHSHRESSRGKPARLYVKAD